MKPEFLLPSFLHRICNSHPKFARFRQGGGALVFQIGIPVIAPAEPGSGGN